MIIAGQAKSHCVASTIADLLNEMVLSDEALAQKVYLLEDCTSPVVIPGVVDYTDQADTAFRGFKEAGMHLVRSTAKSLANAPVSSGPSITTTRTAMERWTPTRLPPASASGRQAGSGSCPFAVA